MKKIIFTIFTIMVLVGCTKFLDQAPSGEQEKSYIFEDYTRARRYMDQLYYTYMPRVWTSSSSYFSTSYPGFLESATDMAEYTASYGAANHSFNVGNWLHSAASREVSSPWTNSYAALRIAYMFLDNIENFNNEPEGRKITMRGETEFMIAFYYFELLKRYGGVPLVKQVLNLESDMKIPRASYEEIVSYIVENLDKAIGNLPDQWSEDDFGRAHKATAYALKSRVLLYAASPLNNPANDQAKWKAAAEAARDCIDYCDSKNMHQLFKGAYQNIFMRAYPEDISEIIMPTNYGNNIINFSDFVINYGCATPGEGFQGYGSNTPTQNFVDRFEVIKFDSDGNAIGSDKFDWNNPEHVKNMYKNRDPRFYQTVLYNDVYWVKRKIETWREGSDKYGKDRNPKDHLFSRTGYYLRKYWPKECYGYNQVGSSRMTGFHIRYGEILLNYAEAMNELYGPDVDNLGRGVFITSRDAVNRIRARLICPANEEISGQEDPYYVIKEERLWNDLPVLKNGMPPIPSGLSIAQMRERVRNERVIELSFEGHYIYDILRWKEGEQLMGGAIYGVDVVKDGTDFRYTRVKVEDRVFDPNRMYHYPIPKSQVYMMGIEQNPGW